jgi:hypothetical protein
MAHRNSLGQELPRSDAIEPSKRNSASPAVNINNSTQAFGERLFSVSDLAKTWHLSTNTIRRIFENEPGVLRWGVKERRFKRRYTTLRIPESVVLRVFRRMQDDRRPTL